MMRSPSYSNQKQVVMSSKLPRRRLNLQMLEDRRVLAGWQNPIIRCDVNGDGNVTSLDAIVVINKLNVDEFSEAGGPLGERDPNSLEPWGDVNGDGWISAVDALQVINALDRNTAEPLIVASLTPESDPNGNGTVQQSTVTLRGQTSPYANVSLMIERIGLQNNVLATLSDPLVVLANSRGEFQLPVQLFAGRNQLSFVAVDELGRPTSTQREVLHGDFAADWNAAILNVVRDWTTTSDDPFPGRIAPSAPPIVAYNLALIHTAMFDAIASIEGGYTTYLSHEPAPNNTSTIAAAASAAFEVAATLYPNAREMSVWQSTLNETLQFESDSAARQRGIDYGALVAARILQSRQGDGTATVVDYTPQLTPGTWNRTVPGSLPPLLPHWGQVLPLTVPDITVFRPEAPPTLDSEHYARDVDEVMRLGDIDSPLRTSEQTAIAQFWADGGGTSTPPGHWNRIAVEVGLSQQQSLIENTRMLAILNLALADAGIASWDAKYHYDLWRPIDAIRQADQDGNSATQVDADWLPLIATPPFPTYTSGHSTFSGAAATVLTNLFGDQLAFTSRRDSHSGSTQTPPSTIEVRHFTNFHDAASEAGESRIFGGIHYRFDSTAGISSGNALAQSIVDGWLVKTTSPDT
jgi:hypothetical protein